MSRPVDLPGVEVLLADNCARRWQVFHETYAICTGLAIDRPTEWKYRGRVHVQDGGGQSLMEPGESHANLKTTAPAWFRVLLIDPVVVEQAARQLDMSPTRPHLKVAQLLRAPLFRPFVQLHAALERSAPPLECQSRFATCLRLMLEQCAERGPRALPAHADHPAVRRARGYIHEHVDERITLDELVSAAGGVSRFHLVHAFTAQVGLPPHAYQIQLRVNGARPLLAAGRRPGDVAADLGFADQSHFTRHFHRIIGVTPAAYVRAAASPRPGPWVSLPGRTARTF